MEESNPSTSLVTLPLNTAQHWPLKLVASYILDIVHLLKYSVAALPTNFDNEGMMPKPRLDLRLYFDYEQEFRHYTKH